jgi:hypothetical protein
MTLDELMATVSYWYALTISRMPIIGQAVLIEYLEDKVDPKFLGYIKMHLMELWEK